MRIIIAGSRHITDITAVWMEISHFHHDLVVSKHADGITEVVSGCAAGVDTLGEQWAEQFNVPIKRFPADWTQYGRRAGVLRNIEMARYADGLLSVWDGKSKGSAHMIKAAGQFGIFRREVVMERSNITKS